MWLIHEEINSPANIITFPCSHFQTEAVLHSIPCSSLSQKRKRVLSFLQITVEILSLLQLTNEVPNKTG